MGENLNATPRFSDRIGATTPPTSLQLHSITDALRNSVWNLLVQIVSQSPSSPYCWTQATEIIAFEFLKQPIDKIPPHPSAAREWFSRAYFELPWYEVYNFLEFIVDHAHLLTDHHLNSRGVANLANVILEREMSGYRFIQGQLAPISTKAEVAAIEEAMSTSDRVGLNGVRTHLSTALKLLGQKPEPDYRNATKEAISAVESAVKHIMGEGGGGLEKALKELAKRTTIHQALHQGFLKLYGYTSDGDGIRHAILEQPTGGFDEAKFMLVACSAFVNFFISKAEAASLLQP